MYSFLSKGNQNIDIYSSFSGGLALEINDQTLYAKKGDVLLFHPGDTYKAWCHGDDHCYFLVTFFSLSSGNAIDILTTNPTAGLYSNEYVKKISNRFCDEYQERFSKLDMPNLGLYASFLTFFADLSTQFGTQTPFSSSKNVLADHRLHSLLNYISDHVENKITVKDMTKCRMTHAVSLLSDSDYSLQEISALLNFSDQYSFTKSFKNYLGEAPGKFRKQYIES